jgi:hypothetical protein
MEMQRARQRDSREKQVSEERQLLKEQENLYKKLDQAKLMKNASTREWIQEEVRKNEAKRNKMLLLEQLQREVDMKYVNSQPVFTTLKQ